MNPELLKKCLSGNASEEELEIYSKWMEGDDDEADAEEIITGDIPVSSEVWARIKAQNLKHDHSQLYKNRAFKLSVAASLLAVFYFFGFQYSAPVGRQLVFHYDQSKPLLEKEFDGLRIRLGQNGKVKMAQQRNELLDISFSGNMMLSNTTSDDKEILVVSKSTGGQVTSKRLNLRKGRSYLLGHYLFKTDELVVTENRDLMNMPPALAMNMKRDFNL